MCCEIVQEVYGLCLYVYKWYLRENKDCDLPANNKV